MKRPNFLDLNFGPISLVSEQSIKSLGLRTVAFGKRKSATDSKRRRAFQRWKEMHLILANLPWRHLQERAEKIPGDKKHLESMLSQSHYVAQFNTNTAHRLLSSAR